VASSKLQAIGGFYLLPSIWELSCPAPFLGKNLKTKKTKAEPIRRKDFELSKNIAENGAGSSRHG
jgi:hypothetical protein